jgi:serine/threonine-protein kinase
MALGRPPTAAVAPVSVSSSRRNSLAWAAAVAVVAISIGVTEWAPWRAEPERPLVRLEVDLGADIALLGITSTNTVVLSPDGRRLLYAASVAGGTGRLYVRRLDQDRAVELPGSEGALTGAFSPDSKSVVFLAGNLVYRTSVEGGAALRLAETDSNTHVAWGDNDTIVVSGWSGLRRIPADGGAPVKLTETDGISIHAQGIVLPGGRNVVFLVGRAGSDVTTLEAVPLAGGNRRVIVNNAGSAHYLSSGHLLYLREGTLFAVRFDPDTLQTSGDALPLVTDVKTTQQGQVLAGTFSVGGDGTLVYRKSTGPAVAPSIGVPGPATIEWIDPAGKRSRSSEPPAPTEAIQRRGYCRTAASFF